MKRKFAVTLAKTYDVGTSREDFYRYIVDTVQNGQRKEARRLFAEMKRSDQFIFLADWLDFSEDIQISTLNACLAELLDQ